MKFEYKITLAYLVVGSLWILFSDTVVNTLITDPDLLARIQTYKGWFYVLMTGVLFYAFLKRHLEKLRTEEKKAREADRLKTIFLQNISHEIRTPMNGIIGFTELLKNKELSPSEKEEYLKVISESSVTLFNLVNEVLDISMIESGAQKVNIRAVSLNELTKELVVQYNPLVKEGISFSARNGLANPDDVIMTDEIKLKQVLVNLIGNSIKFVEKGYIKFGYSMKRNEIEFFIEDTGIGISKDIQEHIFDRFVKDSNNKTRLYDGVGLGLAISKGLVELLGGRIWFESEEGKGTAFFFTLPYIRADLSSGGPGLLKGEKEKHEAGEFIMTLLLAEDNIPNQKYITEVLVRNRIRTLTASNGREALEIFSLNDKIDMVLMDIKMPVMDGYEVTREIRKLRPDIYVIAQSAYAINEKDKALSGGFDDYLSKPFSAQQLMEAINKFIKKSS